MERNEAIKGFYGKTHEKQVEYLVLTAENIISRSKIDYLLDKMRETEDRIELIKIRHGLSKCTNDIEWNNPSIDCCEEVIDIWLKHYTEIADEEDVKVDKRVSLARSSGQDIDCDKEPCDEYDFSDLVEQIKDCVSDMENEINYLSFEIKKALPNYRKLSKEDKKRLEKLSNKRINYKSHVSYKKALIAEFEL